MRTSSKLTAIRSALACYRNAATLYRQALALIRGERQACLFDARHCDAVGDCYMEDFAAC